MNDQAKTACWPDGVILLLRVEVEVFRTSSLQQGINKCPDLTEYPDQQPEEAALSTGVA